MKRNILVTGSHRCGSTWVGRMLDLTPSTHQVFEPFNLGEWSYRAGNNLEFWFEYLVNSNKSDQVMQSFQKIIDRSAYKAYSKRNIRRYFPFLRNGRLIIKDPLACMSSEWLSKKFDLSVVVVVRHPMAFVKSLERMEWNFDFDNFLRQEQLMKDHLNIYRQELRTANKVSFRDQALLLWKCIYSTLKTYIERNDNWVLVRYEDLALSPLEEFEELYGKLDLEFSQKAKEKIISSTSPLNPTEAKGKRTHLLTRNSASLANNWRSKFSEEEIRNAKSKLGLVSEFYYTEEYW